MKNKKPLVALLFVAVIGVVGGTFAYFTSTDSFQNVFRTQPYHMEVTETFESPSDWTPGTTTDKSVIATNKGDVEAADRVSYTESWQDATSSPLPLEDAGHNRAAIINFADDLDTNWTKSTESGKDYYYYNTRLAKDESTTSFIESVTFNPNVTISTENDCQEDEESNTIICTTATDGYVGGTYTLTITVETVQYDQYRTAWGTSVTIS